MKRYTILFLFTLLQFIAYGQEDSKKDIQSEKDSTDLDMSQLLKEVYLSYNVNKFTTTKSEDVARMPLKNIENAQSYSVVTQSLIKDQMVTSYADIFKNIPEVGITSSSSNGRVGVSTRGFKVKSFIVDGMAAYYKTNIDPANIDRIELVRGPSGSLYSNALTSYGGMVNIVTKKPERTFGGQAGYIGGENGLHRFTLDVNTPLDEEGKFLFRLNGSLHQEDSYQDGRFSKDAFLAPSFTYNISDRISLNVDLDYYHTKRTSPWHFIPYKETEFTGIEDLFSVMDRSLSFNYDGAFFDADQLNSRVSLKIDLGSNWSSTTGLSTSYIKEDGVRMGLVGISDEELIHDVRTGPKMYRAINIRQDFLHDYTFANGNYRNRFLIGADYLNYSDSEQKRDAKMDTVNFRNPGNSYFHFDREYVDNYINNLDETKFTKAHQETLGAYVSDVFSIDDRWHFSAALRLDYFNNRGTDDMIKRERKDRFTQTSFSPKFGAVYEMIPQKLSLYANYMNGFNNVNGTDFEGNSFDPEQANQVEAGVKLSTLGGKLISRLSLYDIHVKNVVRDDIDNFDEKIQDGTQMSRGVEYELIANPVRGLDIVLSYAYNYSKYLKAGQGLEGRRPDGAGPENTATFWTSYAMQEGVLRGLKIGMGVNYGSNLRTIKKFDTDFHVPHYTVLDASLSYTKSFYTLSLKVNNLNNTAYYNNRLMWQAPRTFMAGVRVDLERIF